MAAKEDALEEQDVLKLEYDYIRFTWSDINGVARSKIIPKDHVKTAICNGIGAYAGILAFGPKSQPVVPPEVQALRHGNTLVKPEIETLHPVTWSGNTEDTVGEYFCGTFWQNGCPQEACPRHVAQIQCQRLQERGLEILGAFEMEFTLLKGEKPAWLEHGIFSNVITSRYEPFLFQVEKAARSGGVGIETIQAEYAPGQCEFSLTPKSGLKAADDFFLTKQAVKEIAQQHGLTATCMSKPFVGEAGNGAHFNHSLWCLNQEKEINIFHDADDFEGLTALGRHWLEGLSEHARALTALCCPTVNCYRRLHGQWAPFSRSWGLDDRRSTFRVKTSLSSSNRDTYIENRLPGGCANPYIVLAATVAAGLDGIGRQLAPSPACVVSAHGVGNSHTNLLPFTLEEALEELERDEVLVKALGEQFVSWYCQSKREVDLKEVPSTSDRPAESYSDEDAVRERDLYSVFM